MPFKNTIASSVLAMPCLSINFQNQKTHIIKHYKTLIVCVLLWIEIELIYSQARIFQTLDTGIDNRADN